MNEVAIISPDNRLARIKNMEVILSHDSLTDTDKLYIQLASGKQVRDCVGYELRDFCIDLFSIICLNRGFKSYPPEELNHKGSYLASDLLKHHRFSFLSEITEAVKRGSLGMYGDVYGELKDTYDAFNNARIETWLGKFYFENQERSDALAKRNNVIDSLTREARKPISPEESYQISLNNFIKSKEILDAGNFVCRWLWNTGKIRCSKKHWEELIQQARQMIKADYTRQRDIEIQKRHMDEARRIDNVMNNFLNSEQQAAIKAEAARLLLREYFLSLGH